LARYVFAYFLTATDGGGGGDVIGDPQDLLTLRYSNTLTAGKGRVFRVHGHQGSTIGSSIPSSRSKFSLGPVIPMVIFRHPAPRSFFQSRSSLPFATGFLNKTIPDPDKSLGGTLSTGHRVRRMKSLMFVPGLT